MSKNVSELLLVRAYCYLEFLCMTTLATTIGKIFRKWRDEAKCSRGFGGPWIILMELSVMEPDDGMGRHRALSQSAHWDTDDAGVHSTGHWAHRVQGDLRPVGHPLNFTRALDI